MEGRIQEALTLYFFFILGPLQNSRIVRKLGLLAVYFRSITLYPSMECRVIFLPVATKLGQGNVFTAVCDSVNGGGRQTPPQKQTPPKKQTPPTGILSMSGRYASYWNASLLKYQFSLKYSLAFLCSDFQKYKQTLTMATISVAFLSISCFPAVSWFFETARLFLSDWRFSWIKSFWFWMISTVVYCFLKDSKQNVCYLQFANILFQIYLEYM